VLNPDALVDVDGLTVTCQDLQEIGPLPPALCSSAQYVSASVCMCGNNVVSSSLPTTMPPVPSTSAPTTTLRPTITNRPSYSQACNLCIVPEYRVTEPDSVVTLAGFGTSCARLQGLADKGLLSPEVCEAASLEALDLCGCKMPSSPAPSVVATFEPTAVQYPTISPAYKQTCEFCPVTDQTATVTTTGLSIPCGELVQAGKDSFWSPDTCVDAQLSVERDCGCNPSLAPATSHTFQPTDSASPTVTATPTYMEKCAICVGTLSDAIVLMAGVKFTCKEMQEMGANGLIPPEICPMTIAASQESCGCTTTTTTTTTDAPAVPVAPPTKAPTAPTNRGLPTELRNSSATSAGAAWVSLLGLAATLLML
jgi:hypothetical protein